MKLVVKLDKNHVKHAKVVRTKIVSKFVLEMYAVFECEFDVYALVCQNKNALKNVVCLLNNRYK